MMIRRLNKVAEDSPQRAALVVNLVRLFDDSWDDAQDFWNRAVGISAASPLPSDVGRREAAEAAAVTVIAVTLKAAGLWED